MSANHNINQVSKRTLCCVYLSVRLSPCFISLAQVKAQPVAVFFIQALDNVEGALAQSLTHGIKEDHNKITQIT